MIRCLLYSISLLLTGCGGYILEGKVLEGTSSAVQFLPTDHEIFAQYGLDGARYQLTLDPESLGRKVIARGTVAADGSFAIPIQEVGAGFLEYEFELVVRKEGFNSAVATFQLPSREFHALITLAPGPDRYKPRDDPMRDVEQYFRD